MSEHCCSSSHGDINNPVLKRSLWFALIVNASMFVIETIASQTGNSLSLQADALDFFGDASNYAISLFVVSASLTIRAKASIVKAITMAAFGLFVIFSALERAINGSLPAAPVMGGIGFLALFANLMVAWVLFRYRTGDSNMQSVWLCTRNDAIGNVAVIFAAVGVYFGGTRWPDLVVAGMIASLALHSAWRITILATQEIRSEKTS